MRFLQHPANQAQAEGVQWINAPAGHSGSNRWIDATALGSQQAQRFTGAWLAGDGKALAVERLAVVFIALGIALPALSLWIFSKYQITREVHEANLSELGYHDEN